MVSFPPPASLWMFTWIHTSRSELRQQLQHDFIPPLFGIVNVFDISSLQMRRCRTRICAGAVASAERTAASAFSGWIYTQTCGDRRGGWLTANISAVRASDSQQQVRQERLSVQKYLPWGTRGSTVRVQLVGGNREKACSWGKFCITPGASQNYIWLPFPAGVHFQLPPSASTCSANFRMETKVVLPSLNTDKQFEELWNHTFGGKST